MRTCGSGRGCPGGLCEWAGAGGCDSAN
jgi:hypothetical protein